MLCILNVCLFQINSWLCCFVQVEVHFLGFNHKTISVCTDCVRMLFQSVLWRLQGYRVMQWAKETGWHSALQVLVRWEVALTLMWSTEKQTDKTNKYTHKHTNNFTFSFSLLVYDSMAVLCNVYCFQLKIYWIMKFLWNPVCLSFTACFCSHCVVKSLISEGNINAVKSLVLPCCPAS